MIATGYSTWEGSWKEGSGTLATKSDVLPATPYTFASRFEGAPGASPEEFLSTALAGCFNQALTNNFGMIGFTAEHIETSVDIELGYGDNGHPALKNAKVTTTAKAPGLSQEQFDYCAERARTTCTIAMILKLDLAMSATLLA
jgi:osmotically inducible protein OsmC